MSIFKKFATTTLSAGLLAASLSGVAATSAHAEAASVQFADYTALGTTSQYHVYAEGIDWSQPVGVVFFLDGDYWHPSQSRIHFPQDVQLRGMAEVAAERNMIFVPVISPDHDASGNGITWWQNMDYNGDWFRAFASDFIASNNLDAENVWTIGHSGGAEITGFELLADAQDSWRSEGGSVMVGGGNSWGMQTSPSDTAQDFSLQWYIGDADGRGATWPIAWSAWDAAHRGQSIYSAAGFTKADITVIPGMNHHDYDFPAILKESLEKEEPKIVGGIRHYYNTRGGAEVFGKPVTKEYAVEGGIQQIFREADGTELVLFWSSETHVVSELAR